jgi:hypothetical protein
MARKPPSGPTIDVEGKTYDVEKDFTWRELLTVEELGGVPLGRPGAFESMAVGGAFVFVVLKRSQPELTWEAFLDRNVTTEPEAAPRPTRAKTTTT